MAYTNQVDALAYRQEWCRRNKERMQTYARSHRELLWAQKDRPCMDCGGSFHPAAMDFDHRPDEVKLFNIAAARGLKRQRVMDELAKCDVVCANCHRVRTFLREQGENRLPDKGT